MSIKRLSVQLANQIAAGEVVERPASVVKELVENSVDAKASSIVIEIKNAGKQLIKISDNGHGISKDDLSLALAPHATSKISSIEDLDSIMTLGFRGEALASIASVSKLILVSNTKDQEHGYQIFVSGMEQNPVISPAAHQVGTTIEVKELFFNTPARRRFLKSDKTEFNHIKELLIRLALVHYGIEFKFISDGKIVFHVPKQSKADIAQRINKLFGSEFKAACWTIDNSDSDFINSYQSYIKAKASNQGPEAYQPFYINHDVIDIDYNDPLASGILKIHGILLKPESFSKSSPDKIITFLNGRCITDRAINHALREAYLNTVQQDLDFKPAIKGVFFMECDPYIVDVNVHPRKDEVRFHNVNLIHDCIVFNIKAVMELNHVNKESIAKGSLDLDYSNLYQHTISNTNQDHNLISSQQSQAQLHKDHKINHHLHDDNTLKLKESHNSNEDDLLTLNDDLTPPLDHISDKTVCLNAQQSAHEKVQKIQEHKGSLPDRYAFTQKVQQYLHDTKCSDDITQSPLSEDSHLYGKLCNLSTIKDQGQENLVQDHEAISNYHLLNYDHKPSVEQNFIAHQYHSTKQDLNHSLSLDQILLRQEGERYQASNNKINSTKAQDEHDNINTSNVSLDLSINNSYLKQESDSKVSPWQEQGQNGVINIEPDITKISDSTFIKSQINAEFLSLVTADIVLVLCDERYFLIKASELNYELLKHEYINQIKDNSVAIYQLELPFALRCDSNLVKACKSKEVMAAAKRCGFIINAKSARNCLEIIAIPSIIVKSNLAKIALEALNLISCATNSINHDFNCPLELANLLARSKSISINTKLDAQKLISKLNQAHIITFLIKHNYAKELNLLTIATTMLI